MEVVDFVELAQFVLQKLHGLKPENWQWAEFLLSVATGIAGFLFYTIKLWTAGRNAFARKIKPLTEGDDAFWLAPPKIKKKDYVKALENSIPIITIANFKGGVAKSTSAANLAAYFDQLGARVLLIDFDYQGTLTDDLVRTDSFDFSATRLIEGKTPPEVILDHAVKLPAPFGQTDIFPAFYVLERAEGRTVFNWLIGASKHDARFNTQHYLSHEVIQNNYDIVLIDAPPRFATATANALTASTHVLLPTILDNRSVTATMHSLKVIENWQRKINPQLKVLGIVPTMVSYRSRFRPSEQQALYYLQREIADYYVRNGEPWVEVLAEHRLLRRAVIANLAGQQTAYFAESEGAADVRNMYSLLGAELIRRLDGRFRLGARLNAEKQVNVHGQNKVKGNTAPAVMNRDEEDVSKSKGKTGIDAGQRVAPGAARPVKAPVRMAQ